MPVSPVLTDPVAIVKNMQIIVGREMLRRGEYVEELVSNQQLADDGAICGGRRACAVGALYLAARVPMRYETYDDDGEGPVYATMPGVAPNRRGEFMADKPGLAAAYEALNLAAADYGVEHGFDSDPSGHGYGGELETLFERNEEIDPDRLLEVTNIALDMLREG